MEYGKKTENHGKWEIHVLQWTFLNFPPFWVFLTIFHVLKSYTRLRPARKDATNQNLLRQILRVPCSQAEEFWIHAVESFSTVCFTGTLHYHRSPAEEFWIQAGSFSTVCFMGTFINRSFPVMQFWILPVAEGLRSCLKMFLVPGFRHHF